MYWAGHTSFGNAAVVAQEATLADGTRTVASGAVVDNPDDDRPDELELVGASPTPTAFLLPDNKSLLAPLPDGIQDLFVSTTITVNDEGRSVRSAWKSFSDEDTATVIQLAELPRPRNLRIAIGTPEGRDGFLPVRLNPLTPVIPNRGLPWVPFPTHVPEPRDLPSGQVWESFANGLRDSGLLDAYKEGPPKWTVVADLPDGRTLIIGEYQELDNPAWAFSVLLRPDGSVETVERVTEIDPASTAPIIAPAPDGQGTGGGRRGPVDRLPHQRGRLLGGPGQRRRARTGRRQRHQGRGDRDLPGLSNEKRPVHIGRGVLVGTATSS